MSDNKPRENDEKTVMEAHGLLPLGPLFEDASRVVSRYGDLIQKHLGAFPVSVHKGKSFTVYSGRWFMQECIIPNRLKKQRLEMPVGFDTLSIRERVDCKAAGNSFKNRSMEDILMKSSNEIVFLFVYD